MGNPAGVRRDFDALERRRFEALRLLRQGLNQSEAARRVRVVRQSVARWAALERQGGERALRQAGRAGRKPRLTPRQKARLEQHLLAGPERRGYETSLWTSERVAELIEREFGVRYHPGHVWKVLVALGWSCQRPAGRARERNEEAIRHWKKVTWPDIKKKPKTSGVRSFSSTRAD
jgi:transposase